MLTEEQKMEIKRLKEQGLKISQIANQMKLDWKTVKKFITKSQDNKKMDVGKESQNNDFVKENELSKFVFKKLNSDVSPREIVAKIGHVELVAGLYKKWRTFGGEISENLIPSDPKIFKDFYAWVESVEKYPEWHEKMAIKGLAGFAWDRLGSCANRMNTDVECPQIKEINPYECLSCDVYSPGNVLDRCL